MRGATVGARRPPDVGAAGARDRSTAASAAARSPSASSRSATTMSWGEAVGGHVEAEPGDHLEVERGGHRDLGGDDARHAPATSRLTWSSATESAYAERSSTWSCGAAHAASRSWSRASRPPAWSPAPEVAPTAWRARTAAGSASRAERPHPGGVLREHLAAAGAVEQRRGEQGGPVAGAGDDRVDLGGGDPGGAVHRQPAGEHVVAERGEPLAATEQPGGGRRVEATAGEVRSDEPGHRGRGGGLNGDRVRQVGRSVTERRYVRSHQPADRQRTTADVELPTPKVRRDAALRDGESGSSGCRKPAARTAPARRPGRPPRRTSRRPRRRPRAAPAWSTGTGPSGAARSRSRTRGGALAPGVTALDASPRRLRWAM